MHEMPITLSFNMHEMPITLSFNMHEMPPADPRRSRRPVRRRQEAGPPAGQAGQAAAEPPGEAARAGASAAAR
jgi:hypothetical protein